MKTTHGCDGWLREGWAPSTAALEAGAADGEAGDLGVEASGCLTEDFRQ